MAEATSYFAIAMAVIILLVDLWALISVFHSDKTVGVKAAWAIGLIIFPVLGLIVWGVTGPRGVQEGQYHRCTAKDRGSRPAQRFLTYTHPVAPFASSSLWEIA